MHDRLRDSGFPGCTVYDCFGAGQHVVQDLFQGVDWRRDEDAAELMFAVFPRVRALHELLWHLEEALTLVTDDGLRSEVRTAFDTTSRLASGTPGSILRLDVDAHHDQVNAALLRASVQLRGPAADTAPDRRGADLVGADLRAADLRCASLRGARLVGADLTDADLRLADLTGADLRGTRLHGADLSTALFVTPSQLVAATGDAATRLPPRRDRPDHWAH